MQALKDFEDFVTLGYDVGILKEVLSLSAVIASYYGLWNEAIKSYNKMVSIYHHSQ